MPIDEDRPQARIIPVRWQRLDTSEYWKDTLNVFLRVVQDEQGGWVAYRDNYPLLRDGKPARFATCVDAQRAADAHELDLYPNAKAIDDGLSWLPIQRSTGTRSHTVLRSVLTGKGVRPVSCLDLTVNRPRQGGNGDVTCRLDLECRQGIAS